MEGVIWWKIRVILIIKNKYCFFLYFGNHVCVLFGGLGSMGLFLLLGHNPCIWWIGLRNINRENPSYVFLLFT